MIIPTLTADRFVLRAFREDDVPALTALHSDPEVMRYLRLSGEVESRPRQAWDYLAMQMGHWLLKGYGKWALADRASDELIGRVGYFDPPYEWPGLELGWTLSRGVWGRGYATEAARLALDWGFETLRTDEIISAINPDNKASIRVAERLCQRHVRDDQLHGATCRIFGITRDAWNERRHSRP
jgi:RimJ/RimL family protein N-acetyltransferase